MLTSRPCTSLRTSFFFPSCSSSQFSFDMATLSGFRDQNCSHDTPLKNNTAAATALRQVIGFNPSGKGLSTLDSVVSTTFHGSAQRKVSARGPISPRSALQDLLASAREGVSCNGVNTWGLPEKPNQLIPETRKQEGQTTESDDLQSLDTWQFAEAQVGTGLEQAPQSLLRTKAIGFAAVLVESGDNPRGFSQNLRISDTREYRHQHAPASKGCRQKQYGRNSLFLRLATSPSTSDHCADPALSMDFLNSCYLCRRRLAQGRDVFMYNGDKAFCSEECRYQQIVMDERKEKGPPAVIRSGSSAGEAHHTSHHQARCKNQTAAAA